MVTWKKKAEYSPGSGRIYLVCFLFSGHRGIRDELTPMSPCAFSPVGEGTGPATPEANPFKAWPKHTVTGH